jgi:4-amino-4-deoxy-L-arabinose transferase-like glycosyltransferase
MVAAVLVLVPRLWSYGFWDPQEIAVANQARELAAGASTAEIVHGRSPFTTWAVALGIELLGTNELAARLPLVLLGLVAIAATFQLGVRLGSRRAGLLAGLIALSCPIFVFESRQLISAVGATAGNALFALGAVGLLWPVGHRAPVRAGLYAVDAVMLAVGAALAYYTVGAIVGVLAPALALAGATVVSAVQARSAEGGGAGARPRLWAGGIAAVGVAALALLWTAWGVFDLAEASVGDRAIGGVTLHARDGFVQALGGTWRLEVPEELSWDALAQPIAYGLFPWIALAPFALASAAQGGGEPRREWAGYVVFLWTFAGWAAATLTALKVGPTRFAALPAVALAIGLWLDDVLQRRESQTDGEADSLPLAGAVAALIALLLGKDLKSFHDEFAGVHLLGEPFTWPEGLSRALTFVPWTFGAVFAGFLWLGLWAPRALPRAPASATASAIDRAANAIQRAVGEPLARWTSAVGRRGLTAGFATALSFAAVLSWIYTPALSRAFSYKHLFDRYAALRDEHDRLAVLGMPGSGPEYYARGEIETLSNRDQLLGFLAADKRVFAMAPARDLCPLHQAAGARGVSYHVLDDSHAQFILVSNRLQTGEVDHNPLDKALRREPPTDIKSSVAANFDDTIELLGVTMPARVNRGDSFEMKLYFRVLKKPNRNWQVFVHFDGGGLRFQGDHWPINNRCGTNYWQAGDYVVDSFRVTAGNMTSPRTTYRAWIGFFVGSSGNWTNMDVRADTADDAKRVAVGSLKVD